MQELQPFGLQLVREHVDRSSASPKASPPSAPAAREITAGTGEAADKTEPNGIVANQKYDGFRGRFFGGQCRRRASSCNNHGRLLGQLACHVRQTIDPVFRPAVDDRDVLAFNNSDLFEALAE
jgi:hypothetical protein